MSESDKTPVQPLLRWAGSKRQIVTVLADNAPKRFLRYCEPFAGSAALYFHLLPRKSRLSDINEELINTYVTVRRAPASVARALAPLRRNASTYARLRGQDPADLTSINRAVRFIYLNRYCFNGLYRTNRSGQFNVPMASGRTGPLPGAERLKQIAHRLSDAEIRCEDFEEAVADCGAGDFIYADPPYRKDAVRIFSEYDKRPFGESDLERLAETLNGAVSRGAKVLLSYSNCEAVRHLFRSWRCSRVAVRRNVSGFAAARKTEDELLAASF